MWKTFSLFYKPSTVNRLCCDAAYDSCGESCAPHADQHPPGKHANQTCCLLSFRSCYKKICFLANGTNHSRRISLITQVDSLLLSVLLFQVKRRSLTLQFRVALHFDHQTVADWSQFCCKAVSNLILICSLLLILMVVWGVGGNVEIHDSCFSR